MTLTPERKPHQVRVYDEANKTCVGKLCGGYSKTSQGHSNRIFSVNPTHLLTLTNPSHTGTFSARFAPSNPQP